MVTGSLATMSAFHLWSQEVKVADFLFYLFIFLFFLFFIFIFISFIPKLRKNTWIKSIDWLLFKMIIMVSVALSSHPLTKEQNGLARFHRMVNESHLFCSLYFLFGADTETMSVLNVYGYGIYRMQWLGKWEIGNTRTERQLSCCRLFVIVWCSWWLCWP